jgi:hypothetical protein
MRFDFIGPIHPEAISRVTSEALIDEVGGFVRPRLVSVRLLEDGVTRHHTLHVGLAVVTRPRLLGFHQFEGDDTHCEPVRTGAVLLPHEDLRGTVTRGAGDI